MVTFNLFASCVSRDILTPLIKNNKARVLQYCFSVNPISIFSEKPEAEVKFEDLKAKSNFEKRNLCQDVNKTSFEYLTEKIADYIVIDFLGVRFDVMKKGGHCISCTNAYNQNKDILEQIYKMENYEKIYFYGISEEDLIKNLAIFCNKL